MVGDGSSGFRRGVRGLLGLRGVLPFADVPVRTLLRGGPLCAVSAARAGARVVRWAERLARAVGPGRLEAIADVLGRLKADLDRLPKRPRRARKTTRQSLFAPGFTT